jgi:hypothetical protein
MGAKSAEYLSLSVSQSDEVREAEDSGGCPYRTTLLSIANYTTWALCIVLRKKHKKRSKGWRHHPPSWFYNYQGLIKLHSLSVVGTDQRYGRLAPS